MKSLSLFVPALWVALLLASITGGESQLQKCREHDIAITQGEGSLQYNGIPTYIVEITNQCQTRCGIASLHVHCGWFSSAKFISPLVFRRLSYNDCLVNSGRPIPPGTTVSFQYATTFKFPLSISSSKCFKWH